MSVAVARSEHPIAAYAVGEAVGQVVEQVGEAPDLAVLLVSAPHLGALEDIAAAVQRLLRPDSMIGATAAAVVGVPGPGPALSLWAGRGFTARSLRLEGPSVPELAGAGGLLVLGDPFTYDPRVACDAPAPVFGGMASAARGPGGNRLVLDGALFPDGAVATVITGGQLAVTVLSGTRPVGPPRTVTGASGSLLSEVAGRPAVEHLREVLDRLSPEERALAADGLLLGRVIAERVDHPGPGDVLVRRVLGVDTTRGGLAVDDEITIGDTVQLHVRDPRIDDDRPDTGDEAALCFVADAGMPRTEGGPVVGMSCAGIVAPVGGRNFVHHGVAAVARVEVTPR